MPDIVKALHSGRVLLMDGAMGTELFRAGVPRDACLEELNLTQPEVVQGIHRAYVEVGAEVLLTNTFQANLHHLTRHRREQQMDAIYAAAARLARSSGAKGAFVLATVGPTTPRADAQFEALARATVNLDAVLLE